MYEDGETAKIRLKPKYMVRMVQCNCGTTKWTDTTNIQMFTLKGMRNVVCAGCRKQSRKGIWTCECGKRWHRCNLHNIDPIEHKDGGQRVGRAKQLSTAILLPTDRPLPTARKYGANTCNAGTAEELFKASFQKQKDHKHTVYPGGAL